MTDVEIKPKCEEPECEGFPWWNGKRCGEHVPMVDVVVSPVETTIVTRAVTKCPECGHEINIPRDVCVVLSQGGKAEGECPRCRIRHSLQLSSIHVVKPTVAQRFGLRPKP